MASMPTETKNISRKRPIRKNSKAKMKYNKDDPFCNIFLENPSKPRKPLKQLSIRKLNRRGQIGRGNSNRRINEP